METNENSFNLRMYSISLEFKSIMVFVSLKIILIADFTNWSMYYTES